jgi:hypothetical protein
MTGGLKTTRKKDGKVISTINSSVSADGQTLTRTHSFADRGEENVGIYDREK